MTNHPSDLPDIADLPIAVLPKHDDLPERWPAQVHVLQTTTAGTLVNDSSPYGGFNLAFHVGDEAGAVHDNRMRLLSGLPNTSDLPNIKEIQWLTQVHGTQVVDADQLPLSLTPAKGDALITTKPHVALAMMTADCIPLLLCSEGGEQIAAVHAGWRGLAAGVVEATIARMTHKPVFAWVGAFISKDNFEVGLDVKGTFTKLDASYEAAFLAKSNVAKSNVAKDQYINNTKDNNKDNGEHTGKYMADLAAILKHKLDAHGITSRFLGACSYADARFYSHRQACHKGLKHTGRMATLVYKA